MATCQRAQVQPTPYVSVSDCRLRQTIALRSPEAASIDYPNVVALCITGQQLASLGSKPVNLNKPLT